MTSCSYTDSFRLEADIDYVFEDYGEVSSPDGCYQESINSPVESGEAVSAFYSDGGLSDYEYFFRTYEFDDDEVWVIATYLDDTFNTRCIDYDLNDYTTLHPTEVLYWACEDDDGGYTDFSATISTICGCNTPAPTAAPTTPAPTAAPATPGLTATPGPTPNGLTPAPRTLMDTSSPTRAPEVVSTPPPVSTTSDEAAPAGEVAGGVVAGVVVVVAIVLAALFKTGRLKIKRTGKQRKPSHDDVASGSGSMGNTPPAASEPPVPHQYPVAYQYPEAIE
ncbi:hypothetical protein Esi_0357_0013 [Ectocarpus siliculosus]|uniref:Uncharacterized protein n=1 Tax=Ectocarpus siliculosus TaxID=2880 RepID=D7FZ82_ECTSI|nr:hypothetical protein Esi_0357_0013 [Ectocarpus siliculosus]|eukprot:CBJ32699.1 hypothetical protein Esi_0357_0013 [Ectocarpus siliculosus]